MKGQLVQEFEIEVLKNKTSEVTWNGKDNNGNNVGSGIYLFKLNLSGKIAAINKAMLLK